MRAIKTYNTQRVLTNRLKMLGKSEIINNRNEGFIFVPYLIQQDIRIDNFNPILAHSRYSDIDINPNYFCTI